MSAKNRKTLLAPLTLALSASFAVGGLAATAQAADNPFGSSELASGYLQLADNHGKDAEGSCGGKKDKEGKCGEGSCGASKADTDGDGKVSKEEFMAAHEAMFTKMDANGDGMLDADEMKKHHEGMRGGKDKEGKCGEGTCGSQS